MDSELEPGCVIRIKKSLWHNARDTFYKSINFKVNQRINPKDDSLHIIYSNFLSSVGLIDINRDSVFCNNDDYFNFELENPELFFLAKIKYGF